MSVPVAAQNFDIQAAQKRFQDLYSTGDYTAALTEAQKNEATAKRGGTNNITYVLALTDLARAHNKLGHYADAAKMFQQVVDAMQKNIPANDPRLIQAKNNLADAFVNLTRYSDAEQLYQQTLAAMTALLPEGDPALIEVTTRLGTVFMKELRFDAAQAQFDKALDMAEKAGRQNSTQVAVTLNNLSVIYEDQGRFSDVETSLKRALAINEAALGPNHSEVVVNLNNLAHLYERLGRYAEAEGLYRRVIAYWEALNPKHPELATALQNLGAVFAAEERPDEAETLYKQALSIREEAFGPNHFLVATELNNLAQLYELQGRYADVETFAKRALAIVEKTQGPNDPDTAKVLRKLGVAYEGQGRYPDADVQFNRALDIFTKAFGPNHRFLATVLISQGDMFADQDRLDEADAVYKRALAIDEQTRGANHPDVARVLNDLASLSVTRKDLRSAVAYSRKATTAILAHAASNAAGPQLPSDTRGLVQQRAAYFVNHVASLSAAAGAAIEPPPVLGREAFEIAQWASQTSAAAAVQQMSARVALGNGPMEALARESQDLGAAWRETDRQLLEALVKPDSPATRASIAALRQRGVDLETRLAAVTAQLEKGFPEYSALVSPKPASVADVQALLSDSEALVFWLPGEEESYVFAVTKTDFVWHTIADGADALTPKIAKFRVGLDPDLFEQSLRVGKPQQFDAGVAYDLYSELLGPVDALIKGKHDLIVAAAGSLTALPVNLLVTEKPTDPKPTDYVGYRDMAWLMKRHAVTVVPSVASFRTLRMLAPNGQAQKPMVGFGDPVFRPDQTTIDRRRGIRGPNRAPVYTEFWRGAGVDRSSLSSALPQLPDTAIELKSVAESLSVPTSDIHLGKDASETTLKRASLVDYRIVYFATHALVAGDVKGLAEPSIALTMPPQSSDLDDGLLTASEVARLKLNADFVVLSACNTIAGDKPGAEALSGLARAFFYAGARGMLVSHWSVDSNAATYLVSQTFKNLSTTKLGRAEALRQAMLSFIAEPSNQSRNAYPAYWAPFVVIGEGAR